MSHSSSLAMDWNQGDSGHGSPRQHIIALHSLPKRATPMPGMALRQGSAFEPGLKVLLGSLAERVWRMELPEPLDLRYAPEALAERLFHEARLVECTVTRADDQRRESLPANTSMTITDVMIATPDEHQDMLQRFVTGSYRATDLQTLEWDDQGRPIRVLTNLVGIVEGDFMIGLWGVQRSATPERPLRTAPRPIGEMQSHCMCISDAMGTIMFESPELEQVLGIPSAALKGTTWCDLVHPEDRGTMTAAFAANVQDPQHASTVAKVRLRRATGEWVSRAVLCKPLTEVPGPSLISISVRPLPTEAVATPRRRRRASPKTDTRMTTQVCTLNNILALISGHAQLAGMLGDADSELQRHLGIIVEAAERASNTLGRIAE